MDASEKRKVTIIIPDEKPMSWNEFYSGKHWTFRKREVDRVHQLVRAYIDPNWPMFTKPVTIEFRAYFANKKVRLDWVNVSAKLYEDALIGWLIKDDNPDYVISGKIISMIDRKNPRIEIELREV